MSQAAHFFDIESAEQLFGMLHRVAARYMSASAKNPEDMMLLVWGLTHLREWIAPGYDPKKNPTTDEERFFQAIYQIDEFKLLQALANRSKHMANTNLAMAQLHGAPIDNWSEIDSVKSVDTGPVSDYFVDGYDVDDIFRTVIKFYDEQWFKNDVSL